MDGPHLRLSLSYAGGRTALTDLPPDGLGHGWRVDGGVTIRWCPTYADTRPVRFEPTDDLCKGSVPLVLVAGTHLQSGARYRELLEGFQTIIVRGGRTRDKVWFEVHQADGTVMEIGRTPDSRLALRGAAPTGAAEQAAAGRPPHPRLWSINAYRLAPDRVMRYEYFKDERAGIQVPKRIVDSARGTEVLFRYDRRADSINVPFGGYRQSQWLRLHTVEQREDGIRTIEHRFDHAGARGDAERLRRIQTCSFPSSGGAPRCLSPITVRWKRFGARTALADTVVHEAVDPGGITTVFEYELMSAERRHDFAMGAEESPFGVVPPVTGAEALRPTARGYTKLVVTAVDQTARAQNRRLEFGYLRPGLDSGDHWGFLGFRATRMTDVTTGTVMYLQYRMDFPYLADESGRVHYDRRYDSRAKAIGKRYQLYDTLVFDHGPARTYYPYVRQTTELQYSSGLETATRQISDTYTASIDEGLQRMQRKVERGLSAVVAETGSVWGDVRYELEHIVDRELLEFDLSADAAVE